jgi:hypothetical protein
MEPAPKKKLMVGDTVVINNGKALGLGTVIVVNDDGEVLVSWGTIGLNLHLSSSLEIVDPTDLYRR